MTNRRRPSLAITAPKFERYALAIGQLALAWNELYDALGTLFIWSIAKDKECNYQCTHIWAAVTSERQKRALLTAAINHIGRERHLQYPQLALDILWILERATSLEDKRNNVIHSPLTEVSNQLVADISGLQFGDVHANGLLNERGIKLSKSTTQVQKDLLSQIILYRDYAEALASYADEIFTAWRVSPPAWPERPELPSLKDKRTVRAERIKPG